MFFRKNMFGVFGSFIERVGKLTVNWFFVTLTVNWRVNWPLFIRFVFLFNYKIKIWTFPMRLWLRYSACSEEPCELYTFPCSCQLELRLSAPSIWRNLINWEGKRWCLLKLKNSTLAKSNKKHKFLKIYCKF